MNTFKEGLQNEKGIISSLSIMHDNSNADRMWQQQQRRNRSHR